MGSIIGILTTLVTGVIAAPGHGGPAFATSLASAAELPLRIDSQYDFERISPPTQAMDGDLHTIRSTFHCAKSSDPSGKSFMSSPTSLEAPVEDDESQHFLTVRTLRKSPNSSSVQTSSESWSGAPSGVKRKVDNQLLQSDLLWGESKQQADTKRKAKTATNSKLDTSARPDRASKRPKVSTKSPSVGSKEAPSQSGFNPSSRSSGRDQTGNDTRGHTSGPKRGQTMGKPRSSSGQGSRTDEQRRQRAARQQELREEQKRKVKAGDPEALQKQAQMNARRRELGYARKGQAPRQPKTSEAERAVARGKTALYRARQKGLVKPVVFKTSPEERQRSREKMRRARARQRSSTQASEGPSAGTTGQETSQSIKQKSSTRSSSRRQDTKSSSESEWRSGKSETTEPSISTTSISDKPDLGSPSPDLSDLSPSDRSKSPYQTTARQNSIRSGGKGRGPRGRGVALSEPQLSGQQVDANRGQNNPEVTSVPLPRQKQSKSIISSPTNSVQSIREQSAQQLQLHTPLLLPDVPLNLLLPSSSGRQQDNLSGPQHLASMGSMQTPSSMLLQNRPLTSAVPQQANDLWAPLPPNDASLWHTTPPLSPISFGSIPALDFNNSPNPRSPRH